MDKESFNKIIDFDLDNLKENDLKKSLKYFLTLEDESLKKIFLSNYKTIMDYYFKENGLDTKIYSSVYTISNIDAYRIGRLSFYLCSLYGEDKVKLNDDNRIDYYKGYNKFFYRYIDISKMMFSDEIPFIQDLIVFRKENNIKDTYKSFDKAILKDSYNTYFTIDNYYDKHNYNMRVGSFLKKYNIDMNTFKDYVKAYGILYLDLSIRQIENKITSQISALINSIHKDKYDETIRSLLRIKSSDNIEIIDSIILSKNITVDTVKYLFKKGYFDINVYKEISSKIRKRINYLHKNYKYTHYSIALSIIEKTSDFDILIKIVSNNRKILYKNDIVNFISIYRNNLSLEEQERLYLTLYSKISKARTYLEEQEGIKRKKERLEKTKETLKTINFNLLLESNMTVKTFLKTVGISRYEYNNCLSIIKEINPKLYKQIQDKVHHNTKVELVIDDNIAFIANQIKNGIEDNNGDIRKFELLDYFLNTKLDYSDFVSNYINSPFCSTEVLEALKTFFKENEFEKYKGYDNDNKINIDQELNGTLILKIDNELHEVTKEEKETVIAFLQEKEVPLYIKVYKQALKRHIRGNLILESDKKLIKKG